MSHAYDRRRWLATAGAVIAGAAIGMPAARAAEAEGEHGGKEVSAVEDLMREHGILRRALLVYAETASRLAQGKVDVPFAELGRTAALFRRFGEDYHERSLEEQHVFVPLIRGGGPNAALARTLTDQHERGRQVTDYVTAVARKGRSAPADAAALSTTLSDFVRMYARHAAIEDTVVFPAWKAAISAAQYEESNARFEELEHRMFGKDGFEEALAQIASIERAFGLADLGALTARVPPGPG